MTNQPSCYAIPGFTALQLLLGIVLIDLLPQFLHITSNCFMPLGINVVEVQVRRGIPLLRIPVIHGPTHSKVRPRVFVEVFDVSMSD